ncbi:MAG: hypothetical protein N2037_05775 [Acidimicrobiales bacterium]|nr:hypothetical protein [Acidimicrobiales bacterium]
MPWRSVVLAPAAVLPTRSRSKAVVAVPTVAVPGGAVSPAALGSGTCSGAVLSSLLELGARRAVVVGLAGRMGLPGEGAAAVVGG